MKKTLSISILFVAIFAISQPAMAGKVSEATAKTAAINFFKLTAKNITGRTAVTATLTYSKTETDNTVDFYVFDMSPAKGFVIISADDQVSPVIAYSTESNFIAPAQGSGVQCWMNHAGTHIQKAIRGGAVANETIRNQWSAYLNGQKPVSAKASEAGVAPLLTTNWAQEPYYNQLCPFNNADNMRAVTGCVATAMAQIMKFWNYPAQGTGQYGYLNAPPTCFNNYGNQFANFGATTYNWSAMPDTLAGNNLAVATIMYHCGVAVAMNYGDDNEGGSGSYVLASDVASWRHTAQMAYTTYFSYNKNTLQGVHAADYSAADWIALMERELKAGRPIQYAGTDPNEGAHTWVCDGYDANDMLHMNWGWGGLDNGYYSISALTADGYNFSTQEEALIGIEPANNLTVSATTSDATICSGSTTRLNAVSNSANVSYTWTPVTGLSCPTCATTSASPVNTTVYTLNMDSAGLSAISHVTITVNNKMNIESTEVTDASCFGSKNGSAKVEISGGTGAYSYLWNNGETGMSISAIVAGNYSVTVTDAKGCTVSAAATVVQPDALVAAIRSTNAVCSLNDAVLTANAQGGTPSYSFVWNNGQNALSVSSPMAGNYAVTVLDAAGCTSSASFSVAQPSTPAVEIVASNASCSLVYATATANVTGNSQNFSFAWSNGENTSSITDLSAGSFSVTVTDALGCTSSASKNFTQPEPMNVAITTSLVVDTKVYGKATVNVTGGTPQYSYLWNNGANTSEISGLAAGTYSVTITDNKGCNQTATTEISETTGIDNTDKNIAFQVYPNPAVNSASILLGDGYENSTVEIRNLLGQTLLTEKINDKLTGLDLTNFANGIYLVALTQGQHTNIKEITIQK